jgi:hypothetical protein
MKTPSRRSTLIVGRYGSDHDVNWMFDLLIKKHVLFSVAS